MSWRKCKLGDLMTLKRGHDLPDRLRVDGEVPIVSSSGITGCHNEAKAEPPGVVTGRYGTLGEVYFIRSSYWPLNTALYVIDFKGTDPLFAAYFLKNALRNYTSDKAAVPGVDRNVLHALDVVAPDLTIQKQISAFLSAYDDLLEDAARQLYKEWFVRFRFPGHEHSRIIDGIPEGWRGMAASDVIEINPRTGVESGKEITYVPMSSLSEAGMSVDKADFEIRDKHTSVKFKRGDTLFARITPCLENGKTGFVNFLDAEEVACGSTEFVVLRARIVSPYFTYLLSREETFRGNAIKSMIGSSGRQRVQPSCFDRYIVPVPPSRIGKQFDEFVAPTFGQIGNLHKQNQALAQARDLLLPKLMNGEITV